MCRGDHWSPAGVRRTPLRRLFGFGRFVNRPYIVAVRICPRICFCGESMKVKYSAYAECEIIHFVNCEILLLRRNVK